MEEVVVKESEPLDFLDIIVAIVWPFIVIVAFCIVDANLFHWFLLPVYLCGVLTGIDAIRWLRGKMDLYDAKGLIGILGVHFFVVAFLLVAHFEPYRIANIYILDWRPWLGGVAFLNVCGMISYQLAQRWAYNKPTRAAQTYSTLNPVSVRIILPIALVFVFISHVFFMFRMGGISAILNLRTYGDVTAGVFGMGPFMVFGRSIPMLLFISVTIWRYRKLQRSSSIFSVGFVLMVFLIFQFFTGGLTGSRGATVWGLFWAVGIIHFFWRPIPVKWVIIALLPFLFFMYIYGFYKNLGTRVFELFRGVTTIESLSLESKRTFSGMLIGDLSRSDVQPAQLYVIVEKPWHYRYRWGSTYITSVIPLIPRMLWPTKPSDCGKVISGTEMTFGPETYQKKRLLGDYMRSTRIFGLAGEAMLNFGIAGVLPAFFVWGYIVGRIRRRIQSYRFGDTRLLTAPFLISLCFLSLINDMDNLVAVTLFKFLIPALVMYLISTPLPVVEIEDESANVLIPVL